MYENETERMRRLLSLYQKLLATMLFEADENGLIFLDSRISADKKPIEVSVDDKTMQLALPTKTNLNNKNLVIFHPLNEAVGNESLVHSVIRRAYGDRINLALRFAIYSILDKLNSAVFQQHMTADQQQFMRLLSKSNEKDIAQFDNFVKDLTRPQFASFLELVVQSRKGMGKNDLNGETYSKIGRIVPHILSDIQDLSKTKMSARAKACIESIVKTLLPELESENPYAVGSKSTTAPHTLAMLETVAKITEDFKRFEDLFPGSIDISEHVAEDKSGQALLEGFDSDFMDEIRSIDGAVVSAIVRQLPQQRFNKAEKVKQKDSETEPVAQPRHVAVSAPVTMSTQQQVQPVAVQQPTQIQQPATQPTGSVSVMDILTGRSAGKPIEVPQQPQLFQQPIQQPVIQQPVIQQPFYGQQPTFQPQFMQQPVYQQPVMQQQPFYMQGQVSGYVGQQPFGYQQPGVNFGPPIGSGVNPNTPIAF